MWLAPFSAESVSDSKQWHGSMALPYRPSLVANLQSPCFRLSCKCLHVSTAVRIDVNLFISIQTNGLPCFHKCSSCFVQPIAGERKQRHNNTLQLNSCGAIFLAISSRWSISSSSAVAWWDLTVSHDSFCGSSLVQSVVKTKWSTWSVYNLTWHTAHICSDSIQLTKISRWVSASPGFQSRQVDPDPTFAIFAIFFDPGFSLRGMTMKPWN